MVIQEKAFRKIFRPRLNIYGLDEAYFASTYKLIEWEDLLHFYSHTVPNLTAHHSILPGESGWHERPENMHRKDANGNYRAKERVHKQLYYVLSSKLC
jgi:hypothetical protein